jgi:hypothetical protein
MAEALSTKVPTSQEVEALRDVRDTARQALGDAQTALTNTTKACRSAEVLYKEADDAYCAARKASGTTQQPR